MKKVKADSMAVEIMEILNEYRDITADELKDAVKKTAKSVKKEISDNAPVNTGKYKKSWTVTKEKETANTINLVVRSKDRYQLAHLIEKGHAKRKGGRVEGRPHIEPARVMGEKELIDILKKEL